MLAGAAPAYGASGPPSVDRGASLFVGTEPLTGRIRGHAETLPPTATSCINCHDTARRDPARADEQAAPVLDADDLLLARERRGGPPSAFDEHTFCVLLRTAVDPASVLISREMPVYDLDLEQCTSLWLFLIEPRPRHE